MAPEQALGQTVVIENIDVQVRASIGLALAPGHARDVSGLLRAADEAMYRAKHDHTGTQIHDPTATSAHGPTTAVTRAIGRRAAGPTSPTTLSLLADLRKAIATGELTIHVQPQARTDTGHVFAAEALIRWNHPQLGVLAPAQFLPLAERHGLMHDLTTLVLDQSAAAAAAWHATGLELGISVNLHPRSLLDTRTLPIVQAALDRYRLPPALLTLEITEDGVMTDPATAIAVLTELRSAGVRLSVDDFGTGYSSLSYLRQLPVNEVKIDRSFISQITQDTHDQIITRAIVDLGINLAMDVVAEGIETQDTWDHLANLGCHAVQGYHLAKPMPVHHLEPWLHGYATQRRAALHQTRPRLHAI